MRRRTIEKTLRPSLILLACFAIAIVVVPLSRGAVVSAASEPLIPSHQQISYEAQFEVAVDLVTVQVRVVGPDEEFVSGLTADDFTLMIEGEDRPITVLYEMNLPPVLRAEDLEEGLSDAQPAPVTFVESRPSGAGRGLPVSARRHFLLFLDFANASRVGVRKSRTAAQLFLDTYVRADDMVGVAAYSPVTGLQFLVPFTGHHELASRAVESFFSGRAAERLEPQFQDVGLQELTAFENAMSARGGDVAGLPTMAEVLEASQSEQYAGSIASYLDSLTGLGEALTAIQGHKNVVFFSRGFADRVWEMKEGNAFGGGEERETEVREAAMEAAEAFRNADAAVHTFYPDWLPISNVHDISRMEGGASTAPGGLNASASVMIDRQFLNFIAEETGGMSNWFAYNIADGLADVDEVSRSYYVLGYQKLPDDPEVVSVNVVCEFPEAEVASAPTQLANVPAFEQLTSIQRQLQLAEALELGVEASRMTLEIRALPLGTTDGLGRFAVLLQVPMREAQRLARLRDDGTLQFEILGVALDESGHVADYFRNGIRLNASHIHELPAGYDAPFRYYNLFLMPPGQYKAMVVIREAVVGQLSSRSLSLEVPTTESSQPGILGPLRIAPDQTSYLARGPDAAAPSSHRSGLPLGYPFEVHGIELTPDISPMMRAGASYEIWVRIGGVIDDLDAAGLLADLEFDMIDASGNSWKVDYFEPIEEEYDPATERLNLLLWMSLPDDLTVGPQNLRLRFTDPTTRRTRESSLPINIVGR